MPKQDARRTMNSVKANGGCLCGAVSIETSQLGTDAGACHCDICRKWGGGPLFALSSGDDLRIEGRDKVSVYESTPWAERGFCSACGTHLFIRVKQSGRYILPAGLFSAEAALRFDHQIFIDKKPSYYSFSGRTKTLTGEEVFAQHAKTTE
jgi:hypothetical protein